MSTGPSLIRLKAITVLPTIFVAKTKFEAGNFFEICLYVWNFLVRHISPSLASMPNSHGWKLI